MNEGEWEVTWWFEVSDYVGDLWDLERMAKYIGDGHDFASRASDRDLAFDISWDNDCGRATIIVSVPGPAGLITAFLDSLAHTDYFDELDLSLPHNATDEQCAAVVAKYPELHKITRGEEEINREVAA